MTLGELAATAFATLLIAFGPIETAAVFGGLTAGVRRKHRFRLAWRACAIAGAVLLAFAFLGVPLLGALHISLDAFRVAGGVLLLIQAIELVFAHHGGLSALTAAERREAEQPGDIAVFPLAFPLIAGPPTLAATVLLMAQAEGEPLRSAVVLAILVGCLAITYGCMLATDLLHRLLKTTGANVVARLAGVLLAALAIQFIFDGVKGARLFA